MKTKHAGEERHCAKIPYLPCTLLHPHTLSPSSAKFHYSGTIYPTLSNTLFPQHHLNLLSQAILFSAEHWISLHGLPLCACVCGYVYSGVYLCACTCMCVCAWLCVLSIDVFVYLRVHLCVCMGVGSDKKDTEWHVKKDTEWHVKVHLLIILGFILGFHCAQGCLVNPFVLCTSGSQ